MFSYERAVSPIDNDCVVMAKNQAIKRFKLRELTNVYKLRDR